MPYEYMHMFTPLCGLIVLHAGTGKTSLCQALAQKLSVRLSHRYRQGQLVEVNAHSLFSKWFSESGKLVSKLFARIQVLARLVLHILTIALVATQVLTVSLATSCTGDGGGGRRPGVCPDRRGEARCEVSHVHASALTTHRGWSSSVNSTSVLANPPSQQLLYHTSYPQVESLTAARKAAVSGSEPSDAIRAVNALLTQLDALRARSNVMVLTTSNITEAVDLAFVDRTDIKAFIGHPPLQVAHVHTTSIHSAHVCSPLHGRAESLACLAPQARYEILRSCVAELQRAGVVADAAPASSESEERPESSLAPFNHAATEAQVRWSPGVLGQDERALLRKMLGRGLGSHARVT